MAPLDASAIAMLLTVLCAIVRFQLELFQVAVSRRWYIPTGIGT